MLSVKNVNNRIVSSTVQIGLTWIKLWGREKNMQMLDAYAWSMYYNGVSWDFIWLLRKLVSENLNVHQDIT